MAGFQWDAGKAGANFRKHRVDFADAATSVEDPFALTVRDESSEDEERWITLGMAATGDLLVVVWTWRASVVRLISASPASPRERRQYEEQK
jgi:uncharacterized DUF497 family protein